MRKIKLFLSLLMVMLLSVGQMWATPTAATVTNGTQCSNVTINSKSAVKVGTSKNSGDLTLTVGAGATKLSFYAAAWKGSTGKNINVSAPSGVTLSASTVTLIPHDNVTGSFSSITVTPEADYLCELTLSGVSAETAITVSSGTMIRFAIWGATYDTSSGGGEEPGGDPDPGEDPDPTDDADVTLNLLDEGWGFPTSKVVAETSYTNGDYTIKVAGNTGNGFRTYGTYFLLGQTGAYLELPVFTSAIEKIVVAGNGNGSADVAWNIYQGETAVSTQATGCKNDAYTFDIAPANQKANVAHSIKVTNAKNLQIKTIKIYFGEAAAVEAPSVTASGKFVDAKEVSMSCSTEGATIYYTTNGSTPTSTSTQYTAAFNVEETTTIKAIAILGASSSAVTERVYTKVTPLTTMAEVHSAMPEAGNATIDVTITDWIVTGAKDGQSQVWFTNADNTKGILLYKSGHGFVAGKKINGTVFDATITKFNGGPELTTLTASQFTVTDAPEITPAVVTIADLNTNFPADQGRVVKLENVTYNGSAFSDGNNTITIDTRFYNPTALVNGTPYNLSGVVFYGNNVIKIMPRSKDDVKELASKELASISLGGTYPIAFETGDAFSHEGMVVTAHYNGAADETVTASATFTGYDMSATGEQTVTVSYTENTTQVTTTYTINVNAPAPTGDFDEFTGDLVEGDYLIYYDGNLMLAGVTDSRLNYQADVVPVDGTISDPSKYAVWTLAKSGDYWTLYNAKTGMYAASTGAKNKAQLLEDGTDDMSLWTISEGYEIVNKKNTANGVNANLRYNSGYGFACYSTGTGGVLSLYKKAAPSYSITATLTGCTADANNPTKVPQALEDDIDLKYNLTAGYVWPDEITVKSGETTLTADDDYIWDNTSALAELLIFKEAVNGNITITIEAIEKSLESITIAYAPTKVAYETGEFFNPAGLQINLNYTAGASDVVVYNDDTKAGFTFSPDLETALAKTDEIVEITYAGKSVNQAITVTDPVAVEKTVVIIAEYDNKFYAMSNVVSGSACAAIEVTKDGEDLVVTSEDNKAAVQWFMSKLGANVKLQVANNEGKYLSSASNDGNLSLSDAEVNWTLTEDGNNYLFSIGDTRALLYRTTGVFKHYAKSNLINNPNDYFAVSELFEVADGATNIKVVEPIVYEFVVDPDEDVAFGTVELNEPVAAKSFDVTLTNIANATVELSDNTAFEINATALTEDGTITITPKTSVAGNFSATITLHDEAGNAEDKVINVTMKVAAPKDCDKTDDFYTVNANSNYGNRTSDEGWSAVFTAVVTKDDVRYWMIDGGTNKVGIITSPEFNYGIGQLALDYYMPYDEGNGISFKVEIKQGGSVVRTETITKAKADAVTNTIYSAIIENINVTGKFQIVITNLCPANKTDNKDRFAIGNLCWKKYGEPVYDVVREELAPNAYYTMCLEQPVDAVKGASIWKVVSKAENEKDVILEEVEGTLDAGRPYIFYATAATLEVAYNGAAVLDPITEGNNGLIGSFLKASITPDESNYIIYNNELYYVNSGNVYVGEHRAYLNMGGVPAYNSNAPQQGAPRRRVTMAVHSEQVATGIDALNASDAPAKVLINGQLFIIRGEKMFDAKGQLVK